jgi:hypothetical protein
MAKHEAADAIRLLPPGPSRMRAEDIQLEAQAIEKDRQN